MNYEAVICGYRYRFNVSKMAGSSGYFCNISCDSELVMSFQFSVDKFGADVTDEVIQQVVVEYVTAIVVFNERCAPLITVNKLPNRNIDVITENVTLH